MRAARRAVVALLTILLAAGPPGAPGGAARAQESPDVRLELVRQPPYYARGDGLGLRLRIVNRTPEPLEGLILNVQLLGPLTSRSAFYETFDGAPGIGVANRPVESTVPPFGEVAVELDMPMSRLISDLLGPAGAATQGVYPLTVALVDSSLTELDSLTTPAPYYPQAEPGTPLSLVLVVPLNARPARDPFGRFDSTELADALGQRAWLGGTLRALQRLAGRLHLGLAPTPRLVEELADMADGFRGPEGAVGPQSGPSRAARRALDTIRSLVTTPGVQPLLVPYSFADLPTLAAHAPAHLDRQLDEAEDVWRRVLGGSPGRTWVLPPGGALDAATVARLDGLTASRAVVSPDALEDPASLSAEGCADPSLTYSCPVAIDKPQGEIEGFVTDRGLQERLGALVRPGDDALDLQRLLAETAMIREEQPNLAGRVVQMTIPALWHPPGRLLGRLYRRLARAPWLDTVTPAEGLALGTEPVSRELVKRLRSPLALDGSDVATILEAERRVEQFSRARPPDALIERLRRNVLVAESRSWWDPDDPLAEARAMSYATGTLDEISRLLGRLRIESSDTITLTSRSEEIPLRVVNETGFPVHLTLEVESPKLTARRPRQEYVFPDRVTSLMVSVTAQSSGISKLTLRLLLPDCTGPECVIAERELQIRSTDFNNIALALTLGALAFLVLFYASRWLRSRGRETGEE